MIVWFELRNAKICAFVVFEETLKELIRVRFYPGLYA